MYASARNYIEKDPLFQEKSEAGLTGEHITFSAGLRHEGRTWSSHPLHLFGCQLWLKAGMVGSSISYQYALPQTSSMSMTEKK